MLTCYGHRVGVHSAFQLSKCVDIRIERIVQVAKLFHVFDQSFDDRREIAGRVKAEDIPRLFGADLVVPEVLDVLDYEIQATSELCFNRPSHKVADLSYGVIARGNIENS